MRVTTRMVNESARKAGLPVNSTSLLNYINNGSSQNPLLNALGQKNSNVDTTKKINYEKLEKAADQLLQKTQIFTTEGEKSVFAKAGETGNNQQVYEGAEVLIESYNNTIKALKTAPATLNEYYRKMLQEAASENGDALKNIGITISKDGTAVIDKDKLKAASIDSLEKALGESGDFVKKMAFLAERISDNAEANAENLTSQYNSTGKTYSGKLSKYDFWG